MANRGKKLRGIELRPVLCEEAHFADMVEKRAACVEIRHEIQLCLRLEGEAKARDKRMIQDAENRPLRPDVRDLSPLHDRRFSHDLHRKDARPPVAPFLSDQHHLPKGALADHAQLFEAAYTQLFVQPPLHLTGADVGLGGLGCDRREGGPCANALVEARPHPRRVGIA
eukprot:scaffold1941_cov263-Pinguiococcus_pyrenoidosus.AAC.5